MKVEELKKNKMIDIKELRLGNFINFANISYKIEKITSLEHWLFDGNDEELEIHFSKDNKIYWAYISELEGITITEEWLLEFGFEMKTLLDDYYQVEIDQYHLTINSFTFIFDLGVDDFYITQANNHIAIENIKYVHQLQNLYL